MLLLNFSHFSLIYRLMEASYFFSNKWAILQIVLLIFILLGSVVAQGNTATEKGILILKTDFKTDLKKNSIVFLL